MTKEELVNLCKEGNEQALSLLYKTYANKMKRICSQYISDKQTVSDLLHDGFIIIFTSIHTLRSPEKLESWMGKIMKNMSLKYLEQYPEFLEFQGKDKNVPKTNNIQIEECNDTQTPQDLINKAKNLMRSKLEDDIMNAIFSKDEKKERPEFFEKLVTKLLCKMGYGGREDLIIQKCGKSGDGGIDGIIKEDTLGLGKIHIQAKCYSLNHPVAAGDLRDFGGSLLRKKSPKAVFITTSSYTKPAIEYAKENDIILIDGKELLRLMIDYNVGVETKEIVELKKIDLNFFEEED